MNFSSVIPAPNVGISRPQKVSVKGNMYRVPVQHLATDGTVNKHEIWITKEAVQKHYDGMKEDPHNYQIMKLARLTYEKQLRSSNGQLQHKGILVTTDQVSHGNPNLWPSTISHPEVKI